MEGDAIDPVTDPVPGDVVEPVLVPEAGAPGRPARPARRRGVGWWVAVGLTGLVALCVLFYAVTLFQVWSTGRTDQARAVDAIVVMGAAQYDGRPSPQLAARLDHTVVLYKAGLAPLVVVTGGKQPGDRFTEAAASARYLIDRGVPDSAILREPQGRNSWQSIVGVANLLQPRGLHRVLMVSDPYHLLRIREMAGEVGLEAYTSPTPTSTVEGWAQVRREVQEAAVVAVSRVIGYGRFVSWFD